MTTFIKKKLKDREGNYLVTPSSADIVYCSDGETVATKLRKVENDEFSPTITQMSNTSKVGVGEDIDISDNTQEGYLKSAILKGQTLVNMAPKYKGIKNDFFSIDGGGHTQEFNAEYYKVTANDSNCNIALRLYAKEKWQTVQPLKLNAKYLAIVDLDVQVSKNIHLHCGKVSYSGLYGKTLIPGNGRQIVKLQFTTPTEIDNQINIGTDLYNNSGDYVSFYSIMIFEYQEGMENWDIPYFEGMQSVKMPVLTTTGKNLFDGEIELGGFYGSTGLPFNSNDRVRSKNKTLLRKGTYTLSCENAEYVIFSIWSLNGKYIREHSIKNKINTYTFDTDVLINICVLGGDLLGSKILLEENTVATSFEPYKSNILSTPSDLELRGIGDVKDTVNCLTGEVVENTIKLTFSGIENWETSANLTNYMTFRLAKPSNMTTADSHSSASKYVCDKLQIVSSNTVGSTEIEAIWFSAGHMYIRLPKTKASSLEEFKTYLSTNNIQVVSCVKQPVVKTVDLEPSGTNPTTQPYVWKDGHIHLSSEEGSLLPTLDYSVTTSRGGQILENTKHIAKQDKRIYDLEMLMINSSVEDAYQRLLLQNDVQVMSRMDETHLNPMRYYMLTRLIEEKMYEETDMLNKLDTFFLYGDISSDQYFELMDKIFGMEEIIEEDFTEEK